MFQRLGHLVARRWQYIIAFWLILFGGLLVAPYLGWAPKWDDVVQDGEFAFLPADAESKKAETAFAEAFPDDALASQVFVVVRRTTSSKGLTDDDRRFIDKVLAPRVMDAIGFDPENDEDESEAADGAPAQPKGNPDGSEADESPVTDVVWWADRRVGPQHESFDNKATLIAVKLRYEFLDERNAETVENIEQLLHNMRYEKQTVEREDGTTVEISGLDFAISGDATFGRDMMKAAKDSATATERWTVILVIVLLLAIYRAPLLAMIPLLTVAVATEIARHLLSIFAGWGWVDLFAGIETYVTVVVYGAGVDYCLFLIARYKEEIDNSSTTDEAVVLTLDKVGAALTASAGTVMCGIGMMVFAEFGKFQQAGVAITFGLFIVLLAALTFTPAALRAAGRFAFWPHSSSEKIEGDSGWIAPTSLIGSILDKNLLQAGWCRVSRALLARPGTIWLASTLVMLPFAIIGILFFSHLSYGLLSELPDTAPSVHGTKAVQDHFPDGEVGPMKVLIRKDGMQFTKDGDTKKPEKYVEELTSSLAQRMDELDIARIRSWTAPEGIPKPPNVVEPKGRIARMARQAKIDALAFEFYVSHEPRKDAAQSEDPESEPQFDHNATRIDLIPEDDPFSRKSIAGFKQFKENFAKSLPPELKGAELSFVGATASVSDLKEVTDRDQIRIDILVLSGVFLILVILLRRPMISLYLILSVFFSYLATLGVTFAVYWAMDPAGFNGLDWKVPMFLFTILIAVGEDYNIFLMTRIDEESEKHGPVKGITVALEKTGSIISSCGIIMAGTFASLLAGSLVGMDQLGFALAFGVLLDTFVVRPILVPSYLILLHSGRFGKLGNFLGACPVEEAAPQS